VDTNKNDLEYAYIVIVDLNLDTSTRQTFDLNRFDWGNFQCQLKSIFLNPVDPHGEFDDVINLCVVNDVLDAATVDYVIETHFEHNIEPMTTKLFKHIYAEYAALEQPVDGVIDARKILRKKPLARNTRKDKSHAPRQFYFTVDLFSKPHATIRERLKAFDALQSAFMYHFYSSDHETEDTRDSEMPEALEAVVAGLNERGRTAIMNHGSSAETDVSDRQQLSRELVALFSRAFNLNYSRHGAGDVIRMVSRSAPDALIA